MVTAYTYKPWFEARWKDDKIPEEVAVDCYATFACRHKFCREVCPVYQETGNESHSSYGFHVALLAVARGYEKLHQLGDTFTYCLQCGGCQLRCPTTLFTGDFYKITNEHNVLVTKTRYEILKLGFKFKNSDKMMDALNKVVSDIEAKKLPLVEWAKDLNLPRSGEIILFADHYMATQMSTVLRLMAKTLKAAGVNFGIIDDPRPVFTYELDYLDEKGKEYAKHNLKKLREAGAKTVITADPHVHVALTKEYPRILKEDIPFEVVYVTDYVAQLIKEGKLVFKKPVNKKVTYHDSCNLNKVSAIWESPRYILRSIPGLEFIDEDHVTQWYYCCGSGASEVKTFKLLHEDLAYRIGLKRLRRALETGAKTIAVTCPHCNEQLNEVRLKANIDVEIVDIFELLCESLEIK
ncbi:MAG: (Fe-S)-binding protein [Thermoproteota archaeon]